MKFFPRYTLAVVACLVSAPMASAQSAGVGDAFCSLYKQAAENGKDAFTALRGEEMEGNRWRLKDVTVEDGACSVRANDKKQTDMVLCLFRSDSADAAKKWVDDMAASARTCIAGLEGFVEQTARVSDDGKDDQISRAGWVRKSDTGALRISLSAVEKNGQVQTRMTMRYGGAS